MPNYSGIWTLSQQLQAVSANNWPGALQFIAVAHANTPFITAYPWSGSGFGTKFANPATLPTNYCNDVAFI